MRADREHRLGTRELLGGRLSLARAQATRDEHRLDSERLEELRQRSHVLLGQQLRRRHDGRLVSVLHRQQRREQRHDRLAAADVALKQAVHLPVARHVGDDLAYRSRLGVREREWQRVLERAGEQATILERCSAPLLSLQRIRAPMKDVDEEQLLERESRSSARSFGDGLWTVHHRERFAQRRHTRRAQHVVGQVLVDERQQSVEVLIDDPSNHLERESFGGRINRQHLAALYIVVVLPEVDVFARLKLAPVIKAHRSGEQHDVALLDASIEEGLSGPGRLDHPAVVLEDGLEDSQPAPCWKDSLGDHLADDRPVHARLERRDWTDRARVFVAVGDVEEKIARRYDSQLAQRFRAVGSDALQVVDGHLEVDLPAPRLRRGRHLRFEHLVGKSFRIERLQIRRFLANPDEFHWHVQRVVHGEDDSPFSRSVDFGDDDAGDVDRFGESLRLLDRILADRSVENQQRLVRGAREPLGDHAIDLLHLVHQ